MTIKMTMTTDEGHEFTLQHIVSEDALRLARSPRGIVHAVLSVMNKSFEAELLQWADTYAVANL